MIKLFKDNQEYLALIAQRDKAKVELETLENNYGMLQIIEENITAISKSYKIAKRRFRKVSADKAICEAEGKKVDNNLFSRWNSAKENFLKAKGSYKRSESLKAQKAQLEKAKQKYEETEKAILNFLYEHRKTDLLPERLRLEKEIKELVEKFHKKYGHIWGRLKNGIIKCEICGWSNRAMYVYGGYHLDERYKRYAKVVGNGFKIEKEDTWPKEMAEMYDNIMDRKKELKEWIDVLRKTCGRFNHEYESGEDYGVCTICGHKEPYVHRNIDLFYD